MTLNQNFTTVQDDLYLALVAHHRKRIKTLMLENKKLRDAAAAASPSRS